MKKNQSKILKVLGVCLTLLYPFVVFFALQREVPLRFIALLLGIVVVTNFLRSSVKFFSFLILGLGLSGFLYFFNDVLFFKLYPVFMNFLFAFSFTLSLFGGREPLIMKFAKHMGYDVKNVDVILYTRKVTLAWSIFLFLNTLISFVTVFLPNTVWMLYNGFISYVLIGLMMSVEYIIRRRIIKNV